MMQHRSKGAVERRGDGVAARQYSIPPLLQHAVAAFVVLAMCAQAAAQTVRVPPVTRSRWTNGARVAIMEYHRAPTLTVTAVFPGGRSADPPGMSGLASLTADLLRKGTEKRTASQIAEEIDFLGGGLSTDADLDRVTVSLSVLAKDADAGLDLMADVIRHATLPPEELERERQLTIAGLEALPEDPDALAARVASETVYAGHPYGAEPTVTSVRAITRDSVVDYYHRIIAPDRMILVAVGDLHTAELAKRLEARFQDWPAARSSPPSVAPVPAARPRRVLIDKPDATQTQMRLNRAGIARNSPDHFSAQVADTILGGGFTSRLVDEVRVNRGLTYGIGSGFSEHKYGGAFSVSSFTKIETTRALVDATESVLRRTTLSGFTAQELMKARRYLAGLYAIHVQTPEALAGELIDIDFYGLPADYLRTYIARIKAVTGAEANAIARRYFGPESMSLVLLAPGRLVQGQLRGLGVFQTRPAAAIGK